MAAAPLGSGEISTLLSDESQCAAEWVVYEALRNGAWYPWDFQGALRERAREPGFMRQPNGPSTFSGEENQRFPRGD